MNKGDLIAEVAKRGGFSKKDATTAVEVTLDTIKRSVKKEGAVQLLGFGSFQVSKRKARVGRNPQTGEEIKIPAGRTVKFKPGKAFKKMV